MDAGAAGVIAPLINTAEQARELIRSVKYPPHGMRGVGFCRANGYGMRLQEAVEMAHEDTLVCVQIEHAEAVKNIHEILDVPGVVAVMIGGNDRQSIWMNGRRLVFGSPEWQAEYERRVARFMAVLATEKAKVYWVGLPSVRSEEVAASITTGFRLNGCSGLGMP